MKIDKHAHEIQANGKLSCWWARKIARQNQLHLPFFRNRKTPFRNDVVGLSRKIFKFDGLAQALKDWWQLKPGTLAILKKQKYEYYI